MEKLISPHPFTDGYIPKLWLDSSEEPIIIPGIGTGVQTLKDISSNGLDVSQLVAAAQPKTGIDSINGKNALQFNGAEFLSRTNTFLASDYTIFIVARVDAITFSGRFLSQRVTNTLLDLYHSQTNPFNLIFFDGNNQWISNNTVPIGTPFMVVYRLKNGVVGASSIKLEGTESINLNYFPTYSAPDPLLIGDLLGIQFLDGVIGELIVFDSFLPDLAVKWRELYLHNKWAVTWNDTL